MTAHGGSIQGRTPSSGGEVSSSGNEGGGRTPKLFRLLFFSSDVMPLVTIGPVFPFEAFAEVGLRLELALELPAMVR